MNSAKVIERLKAQAEEARQGQEKLLAQNEELIAKSEEAENVRQKLLAQNTDLKRELEHQRRQFELKQEQDDKGRLAEFEKVLEVRSPG